MLHFSRIAGVSGRINSLTSKILLLQRCNGDTILRQTVLKRTPISTLPITRLYSLSQRLQQEQKNEGIPLQFDINKLTRSQIQQLRNMKRVEEQRKKGRSIALYFSSVAIVFLGLAYAAVPLYRAICARTGFGGIPITDRRKFTDDKLIPVDTEKRIRVSFTSEVSQILPWKFVPQQREVYVLPGETALAFYKAKNNSDKDIIGMATYSISPGEAAQYFNKIQCFCFEEQKLAAGEEIDMPVFFFIDPDFASDPAMRNIDDIILHYTFFRAHYGDGSAVSDGASVIPEGSILVKDPDDDDYGGE
ncbi:Cox11p NDAI_0E02260 [Naumovozyma dairenensis CBS 421]|uniref:Cytochrome c oxidase assembly protein CtaG/Cox11 n=1 Tax=Naumovozyma dairenensis (strain ATCC 10597 / BCRC 20456 / CBS 421 / NBRC 0211 / NRRL Y-12639) TaxID=1071378 RepID=G0WBC3_NAUDC|nr:hypothetical protein NDAI_0E02260 [Naumovozyma dairenensis CBS 421]CCD25043.1 hypothetical protein NDAI_0E02260 [Naumovozyma dairenensis CBS 421]